MRLGRLSSLQHNCLMPDDAGAANPTVPLVVQCSFCGLDRRGAEVVHGWADDLFICRDCVQLCAELLSQSGGPPPAPD